MKRHLPEVQHRTSETDLRHLRRRESMTLDELIADGVKQGRLGPQQAKLLREIAESTVGGVAAAKHVREALLASPPAGEAREVEEARRELHEQAEAILATQGKANGYTATEYLQAVEAVAKGRP